MKMTKELVLQTIETINNNTEWTEEIKEQMINEIKKAYADYFKDEKTLKRERKLKRNLNYIIGGLENAIIDGEMELMTEAELIGYCVPEIYNMDAHAGTCVYRDGINKDLKFLGNERINEIILKMGSEVLK